MEKGPRLTVSKQWGGVVDYAYFVIKRQEKSLKNTPTNQKGSLVQLKARKTNECLGECLYKTSILKLIDCTE